MVLIVGYSEIIIYLARSEKCIYVDLRTFVFGFLRILSVFYRAVSILSFSFQFPFALKFIFFVPWASAKKANPLKDGDAKSRI